MPDHINSQVAANIVEEINQERAADAARLLVDAAREGNLAARAAGAVARQNEALRMAMGEVQTVRDFVGTPEHILGSPTTKHGEIAEQVEVAIHRARSLLHGLDASDTFKHPDRTGPVDVVIGGIDVQEKFINGARNSLDHVLAHLDKYADFGRNESYYVIPRDQYAQIQDALHRGAVEGLNDRSVRSLVEKAREISQQTGRSFEDVVRPSLSKYREVQQGVIHRTLDGHEEALRMENGRLVAPHEQERADHSQKENALKTEAAVRSEPSFKEGAQAAAAGGAAGAGVAFASVLYAKWQQGKNVFGGDFTEDDWKEAGLSALQGGVAGSISGGSIYLLTNYTDLSAPFAGAVVSTAFGFKRIYDQYERGEIDESGCTVLGMMVGAEAALVALGATMGQAAIPIPILGSLIGSMAARIFSGFVQQQAGPHAAVIGPRLEREYKAHSAQLDQVLQGRLDDHNERMRLADQLITAVFDDRLSSETRAILSKQVATSFGVPERMIITSIPQLDTFINGVVPSIVTA